MRIIDKNYDFYDYLQNPSDPLVFDRRGSFMLTKEIVCRAVYATTHNKKHGKYNHLLLQCGATFWLFLLTVTHYAPRAINCYDEPDNYDLRLITTWKNYDKPRALLKLTLVDYDAPYLLWRYKDDTTIFDESRIDPEVIQQLFDIYKCTKTRCNLSVWKGHYNEKEYTYPILKSCGIADTVDPLDIFCAVEEYFSLEKTAAERTEPLGATNDDKIVMHGFDTKTSFRGNVRK